VISDAVAAVIGTTAADVAVVVVGEMKTSIPLHLKPLQETQTQS
jgi:hypothetical protein